MYCFKFKFKIKFEFGGGGFWGKAVKLYLLTVITGKKLMLQIPPKVLGSSSML